MRSACLGPEMRLFVQIVHSGKPVLTMGYRGAHNERWYYEEVEIPDNLVILGDAVAHFNPCVSSNMKLT